MPEIPSTTTILEIDVRKSIATIDGTAESLEDELATILNSTRRAVPHVSELLYDEPSYFSDVAQEIPELRNASPENKYTTRHLVETLNRREAYLASLSPVVRSLLEYVPDFTTARFEKPGYRDIGIDLTDPASHEEVVSLRDYGVACQAYYSRPNGATGDPVEGVKPDVFVRKSVAEDIKKVNDFLSHPEITDFFGGEIEIFVEEGWRDPALQKYLYDTVIYNLVHKELAGNPEYAHLSPKELNELAAKERDKKIARPPTSFEDSPSPHATGAAFDLALRYKQQEQGVVSGVNIPMARGVVQMTKFTDPDDFEHVHPQSPEQREGQQNRRALYAIMSGAALRAAGVDFKGFTPNPTEFWHFSHGDQLASIFNGEQPVYGWATHKQ